MAPCWEAAVRGHLLLRRGGGGAIAWLTPRPFECQTRMFGFSEELAGFQRECTPQAEGGPGPGVWQGAGQGCAGPPGPGDQACPRAAGGKGRF